MAGRPRAEADEAGPPERPTARRPQAAAVALSLENAASAHFGSTGRAGRFHVERELPITVVDANGAITPDRITVREGKLRRVEAVASASETSASCTSSLGAKDRAFLITFDSYARLVQPVTHDVALLEREIVARRFNQSASARA